MRKPMFCICENKDADQLRSDHKADQCLCFRYIDSTIPLLSKPLAIFCSCTAWFVSDLVGNQNIGFLRMRLNYILFIIMLTHPCNLDTLKPLISIAQLRFIWAYTVFLISALKHRLWVLIITLLHMSLVVRKLVFGVSDQVRHKPGCTGTEDCKSLEISD